MESETFEEISEVFKQINIDDEPGSEKYDIYTSNSWKYKYKPQPLLPRNKPKYIDFELYVKENCKNMFKILNRETFHQIEKPIVIFFNHFREKCVHHIKWLDRIYELALKYAESIEFIAADIIDMDIIYPGTNPFNFFCRIVRSESESPNIYAIDEKKRIQQHYDAYNTIETLTELCENLLNGKLFPSLPIPENNDSKLVKICVHHNYEELVLNSTKNVFLIINLDRFHYADYEPNYDNVALALKDYNLDIIYMEAETNYIPFEYNANSYPTILYIPYNDKRNFVYYQGMRTEADIIEFLKNIIEKPDFLKLEQQKLKSTILRKVVKVPKDFEINFQDLNQFLKKNFKNKMKVFDRQELQKTKDNVILVFMDFQGKCLEYHIEWLNKIYQVAETAYTFLFLIADFNDIDVINTKWQPKDLIESSQGKPKIFALDRLKHTYELENFVSLPSLFYFTEEVQNKDYYYSQIYQKGNLLQKMTQNPINLLTYLLAEETEELNVEIAKFDIKWNYVDLEYAQDTYPAQYFIPRSNKTKNHLFKGHCLDRYEILEFIKSNIKKYTE